MNDGNTPNTRPPLRWLGVLFALAANMFLVTLANMLVVNLQLSGYFEILATLVGPFLAGIATALYVGQRGGIHAFLGALISVPLMAAYVFNGVWQFAVFAGAFCALGGALTERYLRRHNSRN
ncbi:MAG: hypothetical protein HC802_00985 [Caldilineaceae bacterium]|nr:hypothetical protein [Caldilineaceae bacterium]